MSVMRPRITYHLNRHDELGHLIESGLFVWVGDVCIKVADDEKDIRDFIVNMRELLNDVEEVFGL